MLTGRAILGVVLGPFLFFALILSVALFVPLRLRHGRWMTMSNVRQRRLSRYPRGQLSISGDSYAEVPRPQTTLRRSTHIPHAIASEWNAVQSHENLPQQPAGPRPFISNRVSKPNAKRIPSLRNSFSFPKSRRSTKIEKAIPLTQISRSPLSAIMERSQSNGEASPDLGLIAGLPTETTPRSEPEMNPIDVATNTTTTITRPPSTAWPLPVEEGYSTRKINGQTHLQASSRGDGGSQKFPQGHNAFSARPSIGQRSISLSSQLSSGSAPEEPVPPLPSIPLSGRYPPRRDSKLRFSAASFETASSSILEDRTKSPIQPDAEFTSINLDSPTINLNASGLQIYDSGKDRWSSPGVTRLGSPPGRQIMHSFRQKQASHGSFQGSIDHSSLQRNASGGLSMGLLSEGNSLIPQRNGSTLSTMAARNAETLSSRTGSTKSSTNMFTPGHVARADSMSRISLAGDKGTRLSAQRHSMLETNTRTDRPLVGPAVLQDVSGNQASPNSRPLQKRPASIASENPFQWDRNALQGRPSALKGSTGSRKGHKRQNCVRISNLPAVTIGPAVFPPTAEDPEDPPDTPTQKPKIPGLTLLESHSQAASESRSLLQSSSSRTGQVQDSPFPFSQGPQPAPDRRSQIRASTSRIIFRNGQESQDSGEDVFQSKYDRTLPNIFAASEMHWPLSSVQNPTGEKTVLSAPTVIGEPYDPSSPSLFSRSFPQSTRNTLQGPRSPRQRSPRRGGNIGKLPRSGRGGEDLRRSVMLLRRMNSEAMGRDRSCKEYLNIGNPPSMDVNNSPSIRGKSPSMMSIGGSIWEDASVTGGSSPMESLREKRDVMELEENTKEIEAYEACMSSEKRYTTPQGKGLGLAFGTPGSLYDRDGFLKEYV